MKKIIIKNIWKKFSGNKQSKLNWALKNISLDINSGDIVGIIGKNGAGKSTLLRIITGIYSPDSGKIIKKGKFVSLIGGWVYDQLTIKESIMLYCSINGLRKKEIDKKIRSIISYSEINKSPKTKVYKLSEGMKQRLLISIALHCNPDVLIFDDSDSVADKYFKYKTADKVKNMAKSGLIHLNVSHDMEFLKYCTDKIIWIENGEIIEFGKTKKILELYNSSLQPK